MFFGAGYVWFAIGSDQPVVLLPAFVLAGLGIGCGKPPKAPPSQAWRQANCAARHSGCSLRSSQ
jgi:hypothetical protein